MTTDIGYSDECEPCAASGYEMGVVWMGGHCGEVQAWWVVLATNSAVQYCHLGKQGRLFLCEAWSL